MQVNAEAQTSYQSPTVPSAKHLPRCRTHHHIYGAVLLRTADYCDGATADSPTFPGF